MADFFEKLRKEPQGKRQKIAFTVSAMVSLFVLSGWFIVTWNNFQDSEGTTAENSNFISPLASIRHNFDKLAESGYGQFIEIKNKFNFESDFFSGSVDFENTEYEIIKPERLGGSPDTATSSEEKNDTNSKDLNKSDEE